MTPSPKKKRVHILHKRKKNGKETKIYLRMATGQGGAGTCFAISYPFPHKKFITIPIPKSNGYQTFVSSSSPRVTGIISYSYPYSCSNYFNINFYKKKLW